MFCRDPLCTVKLMEAQAHLGVAAWFRVPPGVRGQHAWLPWGSCSLLPGPGLLGLRLLAWMPLAGPFGVLAHSGW